MKILISDSMSDKAAEIFSNTPGLEVDVITGLKPEELKEKIKDYHGLVVRSATKATKEILDAAVNLKVIGRAGTGVDNIDTKYASQKGIVVMNTPGGNTITTGEHAIAMMVALSRKVPQATASMKAGKWEKKKFQGTELTGKTLGILGVGNIGSVVASRAQGLKMKVISHDPYLSDGAAEKLGITLVSIDELFAKSDFLSIHVPLTNETKNIIGDEAFGKMKKGIRIINCARGGIVDEEALARAVESGKVAGAAFDVFSQEPPEPDNPLLSLDEVIVTPHLGASTHEAQENVAVAVADQLADYLTTGTIRNAINVPSVPAELLSSLGPYIKLGEKLGHFQGQIVSGGIEEIIVEYSGEVAEFDITPITIACIKGLLEKLMDQYVNFVNAPYVAKDRGIKVVEVKSSRSIDFASSVTIRVKTKEGENVVEGAILGKNDPRIVRLDKFLLDVIPDGYLVLLHNVDLPGVIGNVGTLFGANEINIAKLHLGRDTVDKEAVSVWKVDSLPEESVMKELKGLPNIISARIIEL